MLHSMSEWGQESARKNDTGILGLKEHFPVSLGKQQECLFEATRSLKIVLRALRDTYRPCRPSNPDDRSYEVQRATIKAA
jgi:hypothetical protein